MGKGIFDLEKNFAQYGAYHNNKTNIIIHTIFVWPILFTTLLLLYFTPPFIPIPPLLATALPFSLGNILLLNFGFVSVIIYAFFYICLDVVSGTLASILLVACWVGSSILGDALEFSLAWKVTSVCQVVCWCAQFVGHGVFEKRAPALLDNLVQAFLMAPFFVLLEVLLKLFRYEPYPGFGTRVQKVIDYNISEWKKTNKYKKST